MHSVKNVEIGPAGGMAVDELDSHKAGQVLSSGPSGLLSRFPSLAVCLSLVSAPVL